MPMKPFHVGIAAEACAAGLFARAGCNVSVQYDANQPQYDLIIEREDRSLRVSVKGSQNGAWGLVQSFKKGRSYCDAIEYWASQHSAKIFFCFVQFQRVQLMECPRMYLASIAEVAGRLKNSRVGAGSTKIRERWSFKGVVENIPLEWRFTEARVIELLRRAAEPCLAPDRSTAPPLGTRPLRATASAEGRRSANSTGERRDERE